jgi:hypothetical protein
MNAYAYVYKQRAPSKGALKRTHAAALQNPLLTTFLEDYTHSYYDWGDDPSFFASRHILGDVRMATWGVCRRDVRAAIREGDFVVFFCGRKDERIWRYYFVGVGTVKTLVDRHVIWSDSAYSPYRTFFNVLARVDNGGDLV